MAVSAVVAVDGEGLSFVIVLSRNAYHKIATERARTDKHTTDSPQISIISSVIADITSVLYDPKSGVEEPNDPVWGISFMRFEI